MALMGVVGLIKDCFGDEYKTNIEFVLFVIEELAKMAVSIAVLLTMGFSINTTFNNSCHIWGFDAQNIPSLVSTPQ